MTRQVQRHTNNLCQMIVTINQHLRANNLLSTMVGKKVEDEVQEMITITKNQDENQQLFLATQ